MRLFDTIFQQIGSAAVTQLQDKLAIGGTSATPVVNKGIRLIADGLANVAQTEEGRQTLYDSIRYMDDSVVDHPEALFAGKSVGEAVAAGNNTLGELIGRDARDQLSRTLASEVKINQQQADGVVGYLTPEVLGSLKREIDRGNVLDTPDGIGQLFLGSGDPPPAPVAATPAGEAGADTSRVSSLKVRNATTGTAPGVPTTPGVDATKSASVRATGVPDNKRVSDQMPASAAAASSSEASAAARQVAAQTGRDGSDSVDTSSGSSSAVAGAGLSAQGSVSQGSVAQGSVAQSSAPHGSVTQSVASNSASAAPAANAQQDDSADWSWLFRYGLPVLLMGWLVLGGVRNCGGDTPSTAAVPLVGKNVVSEAESAAQASIESLQADLAASRQTAEAAVSGAAESREQLAESREQLAASESRIAELESQIAEIDAEKTVALQRLEQNQGTDTQSAQLQSLVNSVTTERDAAADQLALLQSQLDQASVEKESAVTELAQLREQLDGTGNSGDAMKELRRELESMTAENNVNREAFKRLNVELDKAKVALVEIEELEGRLETLDAEVATAKEETDRVKQELEASRKATDAASAELESATSEIESVKAELEAANAANAETVAQYTQELSSSDSTRQSYQNEIDRLKTVLENTVASSNRDVAVVQAESQQLLSGAELDRDELVAEIDALKAANTELTEQLDQFAVELAMASDTAEDKQVRLATAEEQLATTQAELDKNLLLSDAYETQIQDLESKLETARQSSSSDINRLTSVTSDLQSQLQLLAGARDDAQNGIAERDAQISELTTRESELQAALDSAKADYDQLQSDSESLKSTIEQLQASNTALAENAEQSASALEGGAAKVTELEEALQKRLDDVTEVTGERDELLNEKAQLDEAISALNARLEENTANSTQLSEQVADLTDQLEQANAQKTESDSRVNALNASLTDVQSQLAMSAGDRDKFAKQTELLATETVRYQTEITELREERDELKAQAATLSSDLATLKNDADKAIAESAAATEAAAASTRKATVLEKNVDGLNKEIDRLKGEHSSILANLNLSLSAIEAERDNALIASSSAREQAESFDNEKAEMGAVISDLQSSFDSAQADVVALTNRVSGLETEIQALTSARDASAAEAAELDSKLTASERQLIELSGVADSYKLQLDEADANRRAEIESIIAVREAITGSLDDADVDDVQVTTRENNTAVGITIGSGNLFRPGSAELSQEGRQVLASVGSVIASYKDWKIDVDGHTDNQPIGGALLNRYASNWELSVARASSAVRFLQNEAGIDPVLLSARGFAETRPLDVADTPEARRKNRRVEVVLRKQ